MTKETEIEIFSMVPEDRTAKLKAVLAEMVKEAVQAQTEAAPDHAALEARRTKSMFERLKHSLYYEKWGCRRCSDKTAIHSSGGFCAACFGMMYQRETAIKREWMKQHPDSQIGRAVERITAKAKSAEKLLR